MKTLFTMLLLFFCLPALAQVDVQRRDLKLPGQVMVEKQTISIPLLANTTRLKALTATSASVTTNISTFLAQPDVPRNITITTGGTTTDCKAATVTVTGTNIFGATITEGLSVTADQAGTSTGAKAFRSISQVSVPAQDGAGCTYSIGVGNALGLKRCMEKAGHLLMSTFNGVYESTRATCVADNDEVEKNTCTINGTLDGAKDVEIFFFQNFGCMP